MQRDCCTFPDLQHSAHLRTRAPSRADGEANSGTGSNDWRSHTALLDGCCHQRLRPTNVQTNKATTLRMQLEHQTPTTRLLTSECSHPHFHCETNSG